jgi:hypothetical protein
MTEPARLTPELLARKGQALPTTGFAHAVALGRPLLGPDQHAPGRYDGAPATAGRAGEEARKASRDRRQESAGRRQEDRVALTVRLDRERHRRLRIFGARYACSSQDVIVRALDAYLETCGDDCACLRGAAEACIRN